MALDNEQKPSSFEEQMQTFENELHGITPEPQEPTPEPAPEPPIQNSISLEQQLDIMNRSLEELYLNDIVEDNKAHKEEYTLKTQEDIDRMATSVLSGEHLALTDLERIEHDPNSVTEREGFISAMMEGSKMGELNGEPVYEPITGVGSVFTLIDDALNNRKSEGFTSYYEYWDKSLHGGGMGGRYDLFDGDKDEQWKEHERRLESHVRMLDGNFHSMDDFPNNWSPKMYELSPDYEPGKFVSSQQITERKTNVDKFWRAIAIRDRIYPNGNYPSDLSRENILRHIYGETYDGKAEGGALPAGGRAMVKTINALTFNQFDPYLGYVGSQSAPETVLTVGGEIYGILRSFKWVHGGVDVAWKGGSKALTESGEYISKSGLKYAPKFTSLMVNQSNKVLKTPFVRKTMRAGHWLNKKIGPSDYAKTMTTFAIHGTLQHNPVATWEQKIEEIPVHMKTGAMFHSVNVVAKFLRPTVLGPYLDKGVEMTQVPGIGRAIAGRYTVGTLLESGAVMGMIWNMHEPNPNDPYDNLSRFSNMIAFGILHAKGAGKQNQWREDHINYIKDFSTTAGQPLTKAQAREVYLQHEAKVVEMLNQPEKGPELEKMMKDLIFMGRRATKELKDSKQDSKYAIEMTFRRFEEAKRDGTFDEADVHEFRRNLEGEIVYNEKTEQFMALDYNTVKEGLKRLDTFERQNNIETQSTLPKVDPKETYNTTEKLQSRMQELEVTAELYKSKGQSALDYIESLSKRKDLKAGEEALLKDWKELVSVAEGQGVNIKKVGAPKAVNRFGEKDLQEWSEGELQMELKKRGIEYQSREEFVNREDYDAFTHIEKQRLIDILIESEKLDPRRIEFEEPKAEDKKPVEEGTELVTDSFDAGNQRLFPKEGGIPKSEVDAIKEAGKILKEKQDKTYESDTKGRSEEYKEVYKKEQSAWKDKDTTPEELVRRWEAEDNYNLEGKNRAEQLESARQDIERAKLRYESFKADEIETAKWSSEYHGKKIEELKKEGKVDEWHESQKEIFDKWLSKKEKEASSEVKSELDKNKQLENEEASLKEKWEQEVFRVEEETDGKGNWRTDKKAVEARIELSKKGLEIAEAELKKIKSMPKEKLSKEGKEKIEELELRIETNKKDIKDLTTEPASKNKILETISDSKKTIDVKLAELKKVPMKDIINEFKKIKAENPEMKLKDNKRSKENYIRTMEEYVDKGVQQKVSKVKTEQTQIETIRNFVKKKYGKRFDDNKRFVDDLYSKFGVDRLSDLSKKDRAQFVKDIKKEEIYNQKLQEARDRVKNFGKTGVELGSGPFTPKNIELARDLTRIGMDYINRGSKTFAQFSKNMIKEFGAKVKPWLKDLFKKAKEGIKNYLENPKLGLGIEFVDAEGKKITRPLEYEALRKNKKLMDIGNELSSTLLFDKVEKFPRLDRVDDVATFLTERSKKIQEKYNIDLRVETPETNQIISNALKAEYAREIKKKGNAKGWYSENLQQAIEVSKKIHPELKKESNQTAFKLGMAITSNGATVKENTKVTNLVFDYYKKNKRFPENLQRDINVDMIRSSAMEKAFQTINKLTDRVGEKKFHQFLMNEFTVQDIRDAGIHGLAAYKPTDKVSGSAIFGPKIGGSFFQNLMGNFKPITMDMHLTRNYLRLTGELSGTKSGGSQLRKFVNAIRSNASARKKYNITKETLKNEAAMLDIAKQIVSADAKAGFPKRINPKTKKVERPALVRTAQRFKEVKTKLQDAPTNAQRRRLERILKQAREELGIKDNAELQATLWYPQIRFFERLKGAKGTAPNETDYGTESIKYVQQRGAEAGRGPGFLGTEFSKVNRKGISEIKQLKEVEKRDLLNKLKDPTSLEQLADKARENLSNYGKEGIELGSGPFTPKNMKMVRDLVIIGADKINKGAKSFAKFSKEMVLENGAKVKPWLKELYKSAKELISNPVQWYNKWRGKDATVSKFEAQDVEDLYIRTTENLKPEDLKKRKIKINGVIHLIEAKLKVDGVLNNRDLKNLKKDLFGIKSLKEIMRSDDPSSDLKLQMYQDFLMRYNNRYRSVQIGNKEISIDNLLTGRQQVDIAQRSPVDALVSEIGLFQGKYTNVNRGSYIFKDPDLINDANLSNKQGMGKLFGAPGETMSVKNWEAFKRVFRNGLSTGEWMSVVQQRYPVETFGAWKELRRGYNQVEAHQTEWIGRLNAELKKFGLKDGQKAEEIFTKEERFQIHDALVQRKNEKGEIIQKYDNLSDAQKAFYNIAKEYYSNESFQKVHAVMRFMEWHNKNLDNIGGVPPDVIELSSGELVQGKILRGEGKTNNRYYHIEEADGNIRKIRRGPSIKNVTKTLKNLQDIMLKEQAEGSQTFDNFFKALLNTKGFLIKENYAPQFGGKIRYSFDTPWNEIIQPSKGHLEVRDISGERVKFDAVQNFQKKVRMDGKLIFLHEPMGKFRNIVNSGKLSKEASAEIQKSVNGLDQVKAGDSMAWWDRKFVGAILKSSLGMPRAQFRNRLQGFVHIPEFRLRHIPKLFVRGVVQFANPKVNFNLYNSGSFKKVDPRVQKYFQTEIDQQVALHHEWLYTHHKPVIDRLTSSRVPFMKYIGKASDKMISNYSNVDRANRWEGFISTYNIAEKALTDYASGKKTFKQIKRDIHWDRMNESLRDMMRVELQEIRSGRGDKTFLSMEIADYMVSDKWQYRYAMHERSMHEKNSLGQFRFRILNYPRKIIERTYFASDRLILGISGMRKSLGNDSEAFKSHLGKAKEGVKELTAIALTHYTMDWLYRRVAYNEDERERANSPWRFWTSISGEFFPFGDLISDVAGIGGDWRTLGEATDMYMTGEIDEDEFERAKRQVKKSWLESLDRMSSSMIFGYEVFGVRMFEYIYDREDVRFFQDTLDDEILKRGQYGDDIENSRDLIEGARHVIFGDPWVNPLYRESKKKGGL